MTRRTVLQGVAAAGLAGAGLAAVSGCGGSGSSDFAAPAAGLALAGTDEVPVGGAQVVSAAGGPYVVSQPTAGEFHAFSARCTHRGCAVKAGDGLTLTCPCHGSTFDAATGAVGGGPAPTPLPAVPVTVADGKIVVA